MYLQKVADDKNQQLFCVENSSLFMSLSRFPHIRFSYVLRLKVRNCFF